MKCSIVTIHHIHNFGSVFQAYSLNRFLSLNGYDCEIIDYRPNYYNHGRNRLKTLIANTINLPSYIRRNRKFNNFILQNDDLTKRTFKKTSELERFYCNSDNLFIAGGDQLWNNYHPCGNDDAYKLTFTKSKYKIAYGTSMGRDSFSAAELQEVSYKIKDFQSIMLREQSTVEMIKPYTALPVHHVIDPVGLIDIDDFKDIAVKPEIDEPYAVMYLADSSDLLNDAIDILSKKLGMKIVHICGFRKKCYCDRFEKSVGPEEILGYILHADFVLSASFHATLFSVLFNKQFATILPHKHTNTRISDFLSYVGLSNRIINAEDNLSVIYDRVDYKEVNNIVETLKNNSGNLLLKTLSNLKKE